MQQQIKVDAADCAAGRGCLGSERHCVLCSLHVDAGHNGGSPGRGHPRVNLHPAHASAGHVHPARLLSLALPGMLRCDLMWSVHINRTVICLC